VEEFGFLLNPRSDKVEPDKAQQFLEFEESLHDRIGPKEKFETLYLEEHFGTNTIRHIVTDFATYMLGYTDPDKMDRPAGEKIKDPQRAKMFYQSHWFLFLIRADLYNRELRGAGGWFFKEDDFMALFIRFNLMFYLFFDFSKEELFELNKECPSVELEFLWESRKTELINFTERLGKALREEFKARLKMDDEYAAFHLFVEKIETLIFDENWNELEEDEREYYKDVIRNNQQLIFGFHKVFTKGPNNRNIIIRNARSDHSRSVPCNIEFYPPPVEREVFLDPKGNLFTTSPESRKEIFANNVEYIKKMWSLSLRIGIRDYADQ
jgi:hypothetical protein